VRRLTNFFGVPVMRRHLVLCVARFQRARAARNDYRPQVHFLPSIQSGSASAGPLSWSNLVYRRIDVEVYRKSAERRHDDQ
jgi:hypothetical protein